jgi:hypothetical protein
MVTLTAEQRDEIQKAGDEPIRIEDPETHATYVLLKAEVYDGLKPPPGPESMVGEPVSETYNRSREAFLRDLPELLALRRLRGRWALYRGDQRIGIWRNPRWMQRKILKLGLRLDEYYADVIEPYVEPDEIETSLFEYEEIEPSP